MTDYTTTRALGTSPGGFSMRLFDSLLSWNNRRVTRSELYRLSDRELEDIGLSRGEIDTVVERLR